MPSTIPVYVESGRTRTFACAYDWPGWCRSGKGVEAALDALAAYASRYAPVAKKAKLPFDPPSVSGFRVVERIAGDANTEFGVPMKVTKHDVKPLGGEEAKRLASLVMAAWSVFDDVAARAPAELRKGPRGGGRDRDKMIDHVLNAEGAYARRMGLRLPAPARGERTAIAAFRKAIVDVLSNPSKGGPLVEKGWPQRYAARRIAWHALDHAWEMQDRSKAGA